MTDAADPMLLLRWMRARGGDVPARAISDAGPRAFRHRVDADAALAKLIAAGSIVETCARPRAFRVVEIGRLLPSEEIRRRLQAELADRADLPADAQLYIAAADLKAALIQQLGHACPDCDEIGRRVDDLVMAALGCDPGHHE